MTIRELARLAGVSRMTVSRALNNASDVSPDTRKRIVDLAAKLNYKANPMVTTLMSDVRRRRVGNRKVTLAIVPPPSQEKLWGKELGHVSDQLYRNGVDRRARELGFEVEDFMVADFGGSYGRLSQVLYQRGIQAVLVPSVEDIKLDSNFDYGIEWGHFTAAGIGFSVAHPVDLDRVAMSHFSSTIGALSRMRELGYRRIALGSSSSRIDRTQGRWLGAYLFFQSVNPDIEAIPHFDFENAVTQRSRFLDWFNQHQPEAILGEVQLYKLIRKCGLSVPGDVSFAAIDLLHGHRTCKGLAGNDQRLESLGAAVVDIIANKLSRNERGLPEEPHTLEVSGRWFDGPSLPAV